jgi:sugar phosphate isomerase/epimerase
MIAIGGRAHTVDEITQVCELGYPFVEINFDDPDKIISRLNILTEIKKKYGIYYLVHFPNEGNPTDLKKLQNDFMPKIKKLIELCPNLNIKKGTIHFWMDKQREWASEKIISEKINMLSNMVDYATKFDMTLCLENLSCKYDSFVKFFNEIPDLKMTMDIGHGQLLTEENTSFGFMKYVFKKIKHIHVHDNYGGDEVTDDLHLPLGEGSIPISKIFSILKKKGYNSTMTMEVSPDSMRKTQTIVEQYIL